MKDKRKWEQGVESKIFGIVSRTQTSLSQDESDGEDKRVNKQPSKAHSIDQYHYKNYIIYCLQNV